METLFLDQWGQEITFFLGAAKMIRRLRAAGLPLCRPRVSAIAHDATRFTTATISFSH